ncbi:hypothetical protein [Spongiimicrobium sp. 3-5]|uniref:DUF7079 family protein n=1 Tax=Spongiimicrobium sp. 3-5 TaxID=3332596 RepID=UPI0039812D8A
MIDLKENRDSNNGKADVYKHRRTIWRILSDFYLDTEPQDRDFKLAARIIRNSPYTLDDVKRINKYELFPVLRYNLFRVTGEWQGFDQQILSEAIINSLKKRNLLKKLVLEVSYLLFGSISKEYLKKVEDIYRREAGL